MTPETLGEMLRQRGIDAPPDLLADLVPAAADLGAMAERLRRDLSVLLEAEHSGQGPA